MVFMLQEYEDKKDTPVMAYKNPKCPVQTPTQYQLWIKTPHNTKDRNKTSLASSSIPADVSPGSHTKISSSDLSLPFQSRMQLYPPS